MLEVALFIIFVLVVALIPRLIPYLALGYLFFGGLSGTKILDQFTVQLGSINVFPLDLLYALAFIYALTFFIKILFYAEFKQNIASETKVTILFILFFILIYLGKFINGYYNEAPLDSLIRQFANDTQIVYCFLPLVIYKDIRQFKRLMYFTTVLALIFPICQPFLIGAETTQMIIKGQGTFRLGHGDASILLAMGAIALFTWEHKKYLTFLPLAGIMMLAHRSAYIGITLSFLALSFLKGKKIKTLIMMGGAGILVVGMLAALQSFTNVNILAKNISRAEETFEYNGTTKARVNAMLQVYEEFEKRPFTGLDYKELHDMSASRAARDFNITHPHNFIVSSIATTGIIGTLLLFLLLFRFLHTSYKLAKSPEFKEVGIYLFSSILYFLVFAAMNTTMGNVGYALWFQCGTAMWFFNHLKRTEKQYASLFNKPVQIEAISDNFAVSHEKYSPN